MIIKKITVENWRTLKNPLTLEFGDGINVIYGDNGRGKSTVMEALRMGFFDRHNITGDEIRKIRPWGCELSPRVRIEFSHGGGDYRLTKQFIAQKSCIVERLEPSVGEYQRYMESDGADLWLRSVMSGEASPRGISKPEHWGLAGLLWIPQGAFEYCGLSSALSSRVSGKRSASPESVQISEGKAEKAIRQGYLKYFTEQGNPRGGAASLKELEARIARKRADLGRKQRQLLEMESLRDSMDIAKKQIAHSIESEGDILKRLKEAEEKIAEYDRLKAEHEQAKARRDVLELKKKSLERDLSDINEAQNSVKRYRKQASYRVKEMENAKAQMARLDEQIREKFAEKDGLSSTVKLEFDAEAELTWEPLDCETAAGANGASPRVVRAGEKIAIEGLGRVRARIPSVGTFTVTGPVNDNAAALRERINTLKQQLEAHMKIIENCGRDIDGCNESIERANDKLALMFADGRTAESVAVEHKEILGEIFVVNKTIADLVAQVQRLGYNPHIAVGDLKAQAEEVRERREFLNKRISEYHGQIKAFGGMGLYEEADAEEEELRKMEASFGAEFVRASALKLIWDTIRDVKREFQEQVATPVERRASGLFSLVNGRRAGAVKLNDDFSVAGFVPEELEATPVETGSLSGGEREQLYFCTRLALAEFLIGEDAAEKHTLALDDFFTATDEKCLSRLTDLLLTFENRYQYLIFTCHRGRYANINSADVRSMEI